MADKDAFEQFEEFLNPRIVREKFAAAGLYIVAYEMLERSIIDRIRDFYCFGTRGTKIDSPYDQKVLALDPKGKKDRLRSSLIWLQQNNVLTTKDVEQFISIKDARNELAHELTAFIGASRDFEIAAHLQGAIDLLRKIETGWVINLDIATDPDLAHEEIGPEDVTPGKIMLMQIMIDVTLGDDDKALKHLNAFRDQRVKR